MKAARSPRGRTITFNVPTLLSEGWAGRPLPGRRATS